MNIYPQRPPETETMKQLDGWVTLIHTEIRELTPEEREEYQIPDEEEAYTDRIAVYRHINPLMDDDYGPLVSTIIRCKYSEDSVEAITQNYLASQTPEHIEDFDELQVWRDNSKRLAHLAIGN